MLNSHVFHRLAIITCTLLASQQSIALAQDVIGKTTPDKLHYGHAIYQHYLQRPLLAANELTTGFKQGTIDKDSAHAHILLGQIYSDLQLSNQAKEEFELVIKKDILSSTKNKTWYHLANISFQEGDYASTIAILTKRISHNAAQEILDKKSILLANAYLKQKRLKKAYTVLESLADDSFAAAYTRYNIGTTLIAKNQADAGVALLDKLMQLKPSSSEIKALRERSALAAGYTRIQQGKCQSAKKYLAIIPLDSIYSSDALLGSGFCSFKSKDFRAALPPLHELMQGAITSASVQEGIFLTPQTYEAIGANNKAIFGYQYAIHVLENQEKKVSQAIKKAAQNNWFDAIQNVSQGQIDDSPLINNYFHTLFRSQDFNQALTQYQQIHEYKQLLTQWQKKLPILQHAVQVHKAKVRLSLPSVEPRLYTLTNEVQRLKNTQQQTTKKTELRKNKREQFANDAYLKMRTLRKLNTKIQRFPPQIQKQFQPRMDKVRAVLIYNLNTRHKSAGSAYNEKQKNTSVSTSIDVLSTRIKALSELVQANKALTSTSYEQRFTQIEHDINSILRALTQFSTTREQTMRNIANRVFLEDFLLVKNHLGEAHHALGRLQAEQSLQAQKKASAKTE